MHLEIGQLIGFMISAFCFGCVSHAFLQTMIGVTRDHRARMRQYDEKIAKLDAEIDEMNEIIELEETWNLPTRKDDER